MLLDKTLVLKGLAGIAAVGGVVGGGFAVKKAGLLSPSSNAGADQSQTQNQEDSEQAQKNAEEIKRQKEEKKSKVNEQLTKLGLDSGCHVEIDNFSSPTAFSKECDLDQAKLQNIKFSNKAENSNVTVSGLTGSIKLKIANKGDDKVSYKFSGHGSKITISGDSTKPKITLKANEEREFEENSEGKLSKVPASGATNASTLNTKIKNLGLSNKCWFEEGENESSVECSLDKNEFQKIPFSNKGNTNVTVEGLNSGSINLKIEKKGADKLGYKFSGASSKITITGDAEKGIITLPQTAEREFEEKEEGKLSKVSATSNASTFNTKIKNLGIPNKCLFEEGEDEGSIECTLDKTEFQKIPFSNKGNTDVTVEGLTDGGNIKLKIEKKDNNSKLGFTFSDITSKLTIKGDQTKPNITLKADETREFEEKSGGKLGKVVKNASTSTKIKAANTKLGTINIPSQCRFEEEDSETSLECDLSKQDDLKNIKFYNRESNKQMTIVGSTTGLKLTVNRFEDGEGERKYQTGVDLEFLFSGNTSEVKIQGGDTFNTNDIVLKPNINRPLTINDQSKLAKATNSSTIATKLGLSCTKDTANTSISTFNCTPWEGGKKIKFLNSEGTDIEKEITFGSGDASTTILTTTEDSANYELGIKFTGKTNYPDTDSKIQSGSCYEAKYIPGKDKG